MLLVAWRGCDQYSSVQLYSCTAVLDLDLDLDLVFEYEYLLQEVSYM